MNKIDFNIALKNLVGSFPTESGFKKRMRLHQGWWRTFVLNQTAGKSSNKKSKLKNVANLLPNVKTDGNFLNERIVSVVVETLTARNDKGAGIIDEDRLYRNLLSSQPLCFNFFAEFELDKIFALQVLKEFIPSILKVNKVFFEYAPQENYTKDHSAFDVVFEIETKDGLGLFGIECKYTDTFSYKRTGGTYYGAEGDKNYTTYKAILDANGDHFKSSYDEYVESSNYNQLFRNELVGRAIISDKNNKYNFVYTGLFCHQNDKAVKTGIEFQSMIEGNEKQFKIITYQKLIETMQKLDLAWEKRELSMLLWARYCGIQLSDNLDKILINKV